MVELQILTLRFQCGTWESAFLRCSPTCCSRCRSTDHTWSSSSQIHGSKLHLSPTFCLDVTCCIYKQLGLPNAPLFCSSVGTMGTACSMGLSGEPQAVCSLLWSPQLSVGRSQHPCRWKLVLWSAGGELLTQRVCCVFGKKEKEEGRLMRRFTGRDTHPSISWTKEQMVTSK